MQRTYDVVIERDSEGYFVANVPALPGCHTQAKTLDELRTRVHEAIEVYLEFEEQTPDPSEFIAVERVTIEI
jgi:predicted RNase H-like HicB family nuclease